MVEALIVLFVLSVGVSVVHPLVYAVMDCHERYRATRAHREAHEWDGPSEKGI